MGNDFDEHGRSYGENSLLCEYRKKCGAGKINIIDGSGECKVIDASSGKGNTNYALSKMEFATRILHREKPFDNVDFSAFIKLFEVIRDILKE